MAIERSVPPVSAGSKGRHDNRMLRGTLLTAGLFALSAFGFGVIATPTSMAQANEKGPFNCEVTKATVDIGNDTEGEVFTAVSTEIEFADDQDPRCDAVKVLGEVKYSDVTFTKKGDICEIAASKVVGNGKDDDGDRDRVSGGKGSITVPIGGGPAKVKVEVTTTADSENGAGTIHAEGKGTGIKLETCDSSGVPEAATVTAEGKGGFTPKS